MLAAVCLLMPPLSPPAAVPFCRPAFWLMVSGSTALNPLDLCAVACISIALLLQLLALKLQRACSQVAAGLSQGRAPG
jgi:hypothetical protein